MKATKSQGILVAPISSEWPLADSSKELGTLVLEPEGTEYPNNQNEQENGFLLKGIKLWPPLDLAQ